MRGGSGEAVDAFAALAIIGVAERSQGPRLDARLFQSFPPRRFLQVDIVTRFALGKTRGKLTSVS